MFNDASVVDIPRTCKVILPTAPRRAVSLNHGMKMTSWYDIKSIDKPPKSGPTEQYLEHSYSQNEISKSAKLVTELIKKEIEDLDG